MVCLLCTVVNVCPMCLASCVSASASTSEPAKRKAKAQVLECSITPINQHNTQQTKKHIQHPPTLSRSGNPTGGGILIRGVLYINRGSCCFFRLESWVFVRIYRRLQQSDLNLQTTNPRLGGCHGRHTLCLFSAPIASYGPTLRQYKAT